MKARVLPPTQEALEEAVRCLLRSEVIGMPTETVYGLAGVATDEKAVTRIFEAKERPTFDPLIVHVAPPTAGLPSFREIAPLIDPARLTAEARNTAGKLMASFWPGPLTLILPKSASIPDLVTSGMDTVGIRMPKHPVAQALIRAAGAPLAAPSANRFGRISPTSAEDVETELGDRIPLILDGGHCAVGVESTVVRVDPQGRVVLLRPGGVAKEALEATLHEKVSVQAQTSGAAGYEAPGMTESHYAPSKPLRLLPAEVLQMSDADFAGLENLRGNKVALLTLFSDPEASAKRLEERTGAKVLEALALSTEKDWARAARALFSSLRKLDSSSATHLISEPCRADSGLGHAIADRLRRASAKRA